MQHPASTLLTTSPCPHPYLHPPNNMPPPCPHPPNNIPLPPTRPPPPEVKAAEERMDKAAHSKLYPDRKPRNEYVDIHMDLQHRIHQLLDTGDNGA